MFEKLQTGVEFSGKKEKSAAIKLQIHNKGIFEERAHFKKITFSRKDAFQSSRVHFKERVHLKENVQFKKTAYCQRMTSKKSAIREPHCAMQQCNNRTQL